MGPCNVKFQEAGCSNIKTAMVMYELHKPLHRERTAKSKTYVQNVIQPTLLSLCEESECVVSSEIMEDTLPVNLIEHENGFLIIPDRHLTDVRNAQYNHVDNTLQQELAEELIEDSESVSSQMELTVLRSGRKIKPRRDHIFLHL